MDVADQEESIDLDDSSANQNGIVSDIPDQNKKSNKNLYLETESRRESFTDSCWEI